MNGSVTRPGPGTPGALALSVTVSVAMAMAMAMAVAAGCGVPLEDRAVATPADSLPYGLQNPPTSEAFTTEPTNAVIYLVAGDELVGVPRTVSEPGDLAMLMTALTEPLPEADTAEGFRRALTDAELVGEVTETAGLARVELTRSFDRISSREQILALGQVVFTLTELDEIDRVRFTRDGERLAIPTGDGSLVNSPVSRRDYANLR